MWGAATSAYQIEGSPLADGAGESIWHRFAHCPGKIDGGDHGDVACDHYRRFADDVRLMRELGIQSYRFSIAWARVLPEGTGRVNPRGLDFYTRLVDTLLEHGIEPIATLYHWDLPAALEDRGGWAHRRCAEVVRRICAADVPHAGRPRADVGHDQRTLGHDGQRLRDGRPRTGPPRLGRGREVSQNLLRAHAAAVAVYRAEAKQQIGLVVNLVPVHPATDSDGRPRGGRANGRLSQSPIPRSGAAGDVSRGAAGNVRRRLAGDGPRRTGAAAAADRLRGHQLLPADLSSATTPSAGPAAGRRSFRRPIVRTPPWVGKSTRRDSTDTLDGSASRYGDLPLYITENGAAFDDIPQPDGSVNDVERVKYLKEHLQAAGQALRAGVDLRGYFVWSLFDNFEWQHGYSKRFGIVRVDFPTQRRIPKASARFYSQVIRTAGANLEASLRGNSA